MSDPDDRPKPIEDTLRQAERLNDRIDDLRWYVTRLFALGAFVAVGLPVYLGFNLKNERDTLRQFVADAKQEVREALGKTLQPPEVILLGPNRRPLEGQTIQAKIERLADRKWVLKFNTIEKNEGGSSSSRRFYKLYASDPLRLSDTSSDEPNFKYEAYINPDKVYPPELFARVSQNSYWIYDLAAQPPLGTYPVLLKVYYGNDRVSSVRFSVSLSKGS